MRRSRSDDVLAPKTRPIIYGLVDPRTGELRYIGQSTKGLERARSHWWPSTLRAESHTHKARWLKSLLACGMVPEVVILEHCRSTRDLPDAERFWIRRARKRGAQLTNVSDGGESGACGYRWSAEQRAALRASRSTEEWKTKARWSRLAVVRRPEYRRLQSERAFAAAARPAVKAARAKLAADPEYRQKLSRAGGGRPVRCIETRALYPSLSEAARRFGVTPAVMSAALTGRQNTVKGLHVRYEGEPLRPRRNVSGEHHPAAKLTQTQADAVRSRHASGESQRTLATEFGVSRGVIRAIVLGLGYRSL